MIRFYKNTELPDFRKAGYFDVMFFGIHEMSTNEPDQFEIYAGGSTDPITSFKHLILDNLGNTLSEVVLDETMITIILGMYVCYWNGFGDTLDNGFGQFEVSNGTITWLSEPFRVSSENTISANLGDFNNDFDYSYNSD